MGQSVIGGKPNWLGELAKGREQEGVDGEAGGD
jgi:hypothetical protein